jgi:hypothetical protein
MLKNILFVVLFAGLLFVLYPGFMETINGTSTQTFDVVLEDSSATDAIVITSEPYNEIQWTVIKGVVSAEAKHTSDIDYLNIHATELLTGLGYSIVDVSVSKKITKITMPDTK